VPPIARGLKPLVDKLAIDIAGASNPETHYFTWKGPENCSVGIKPGGVPKAVTIGNGFVAAKAATPTAPAACGTPPAKRSARKPAFPA